MNQVCQQFPYTNLLNQFVIFCTDQQQPNRERDDAIFFDRIHSGIDK